MNALDQIPPGRSISDEQKQALIENLRLEVAERARKLRAQYAAQAQTLRIRVEMRINRIPTALRKIKMGELYAMHDGGDKSTEQIHRRLQSRTSIAKVQEANHDSAAATNKRTSDDVYVQHAPTRSIAIHEDIGPMPKKRVKLAEKPLSHAPLNPAILSPKSSNTRIRPGASAKSYFQPEPTFPQKNVSKLHGDLHADHENPPATRSAHAASASNKAIPAVQPSQKRPKANAAVRKRDPAKDSEAPAQRTLSTSSSSSAFSIGTTVVTEVVQKKKKQQQQQQQAKSASTSKKRAPASRSTATSKTVHVGTSAPPMAATKAKSSTTQRVLRNR